MIYQTLGVNKSRRLRWAGHVVNMEEMRNIYKILIGKPEGKNHLEDLDIDGRIIFEWILEKWGGSCGFGLIWLMIGNTGRLLGTLS